MKMNLYPEMNEKIVKILRVDDENPSNLYAAQLIEEQTQKIIELEEKLDKLEKQGKENKCPICKNAIENNSIEVKVSKRLFNHATNSHYYKDIETLSFCSEDCRKIFINNGVKKQRESELNNKLSKCPFLQK